MKSNGTIYWYGANSASLMESDLSGNGQRWYYFFNGQRVGRQLPSNEVGFYMTDHLGNVRFLSGCCTGYSLDYYPFGGVITNSDTGDDRYQFTGKERDSESGLDNFGARYYGSSTGRFMTPDWAARPTAVPYAVYGDPQSLNLYTYVRNNTLNRVDLDGHYELNASGCAKDNAKCQKKYDKAANKFESQRQKDLNSKKADVRAAAAAYGDLGDANGVHVGFADLSSQHISGSVDASSSTPGGGANGINIQVTIDFGRAGSAETQTHEGTHVADDQKFLNSWNPGWGGYMETLTHGRTEFNAFKAGAEINQEHGFGPNGDRKIWNFLRNDPNYKNILNVPVFDPKDFPAAVAQD
jgi:RHS repeat-associated protein